MNTLSIQRPRPSIEIRTPAPFSTSTNRGDVNWLPWSVLKIPGAPKRASASSTAAMQNSTSIVFDIEAAQGKTMPLGISTRDCDDMCPEMVSIPAGSFRMGSPLNEPHRQDYEGPQYEVKITYSYSASDSSRYECPVFLESHAT